MSSNAPYDDLNRFDIQKILVNATEVIPDVEQGSREYTSEQYRHAQDTQRRLACTLASGGPYKLPDTALTTTGSLTI